MAKIEITRIPFIKNALKCRYPQMAVFIVMLAGYIFAILAGLIGTPVGSHNFSIVFVWIAWWAVLILVAVPFFGRGWCAVCPIPLPGEWLQREVAQGGTEAALVFWFAKENRFEYALAQDAYQWHVSREYGTATLPLPRLLWNGSAAEAQEIRALMPDRSRRKVGLYLQRIS